MTTLILLVVKGITFALYKCKSLEKSFDYDSASGHDGM